MSKPSAVIDVLRAILKFWSDGYELYERFFFDSTYEAQQSGELDSDQILLMMTWALLI